MRVSVIEGHRLWAPTYDSAPNPLLALESRTVTALLDHKRPARVIDVGCGTGRWMLHFAKQGATVFGVDLCQEMLCEAERHPALPGRLVRADAENLPLQHGVADLAICSFAAAYIRNLPRALWEMARICTPGARVVVSDMHPLAAAAGWTRSFRSRSSLYEMNHFAYSTAEMRAAAVCAGLQLQAQIDGHFDQREHPIFESAGKKHLIEHVNTVPAVWIGIWMRP